MRKFLKYLILGTAIAALFFSLWKYPTTCAIPAEPQFTKQKQTDLAVYMIENYTSSNFYVIIYSKKGVFWSDVVSRSVPGLPVSMGGPILLQAKKQYYIWGQCQRCYKEIHMGFKGRFMSDLPLTSKAWGLKIVDHECNKLPV